jgi:hypothetical protein
LVTKQLLETEEAAGIDQPGQQQSSTSQFLALFELLQLLQLLASPDHSRWSRRMSRCLLDENTVRENLET